MKIFNLKPLSCLYTLSQDIYAVYFLKLFNFHEYLRVKTIIVTRSKNLKISPFRHPLYLVKF